MQSFWLVVLLPLCYASFMHNEGQFDDLDDSFQIHDPTLLGEFVKHLNEQGVGQCLSKKRKSPINIDLGKVYVVSLPQLVFENYAGTENVSESIQSNFTASIHGYTNWTSKPTLSGGPLNGEYHLMEVHWEMFDLAFNGAHYHYGHTVNDAKQDFELHFIHTKGGLSVDEAQLVPGGIVIVAVFVNMVQPSVYDIRAYNNTAFDLPEEPGNEFTWISPETFLPDELDSYFVYNGSFAHPPCNGDVTWIVLANPTQMTSLDLISYMRTTQSHSSLSTMSVKKRAHPEVLFNHPNHVSQTPVQLPSTSSNAIIVFLGVAFALACIVALGLLFFYFTKDCAKKTVEEETEDRRPVVNYQIGFENLNFS